MGAKKEEEAIKEVIDHLASSFDRELYAMSAQEIAEEWYWRWDESQSVAYNVYVFSDILDLHKRRWERWEEEHNGSCCVVERVRDKYAMRRVHEFLEELNSHQNKKTKKGKKYVEGYQ